MSVLTLGAGYDALVSLVDNIVGLGDIGDFLEEAASWDAFQIGVYCMSDPASVTKNTSTQAIFSSGNYQYVVNGTGLSLSNGGVANANFGDYLAHSSGTITSIAIYDGDTGNTDYLLGTLSLSATAITLNVDGQSVVLEGASLPTALSVMQALANQDYTGGEILTIDGVKLYSDGDLVCDVDFPDTPLLAGMSDYLDVVNIVGEVGSGGDFTSVQLSSTQLVFENDGGNHIVITGSGIGYADGGILDPDEITGTITSVRLYDDNSSYNSSTHTVSGTVMATMTISSTRVQLSAGDFVVTFNGSGLPTDVGTWKSIIDSSYSGTALGVTSLSMTKDGENVLSVALTSTTATLSTLGYTFTLTGNFSTALTAAILSGDTNPTLNASALTVTDASGATVLSISGLTAPVSLFGENDFLSTLSQVVASATSTGTLFDVSCGLLVDDVDFGGSIAITSVTGSAGNDAFLVGTGNVTVVGGAGSDTLSFARTSVEMGVSFDLSNTGAQTTGGAGTVTASGIENLTGSVYGDYLVGNASGNLITGGAGNDTIIGGAGNDTAVFAGVMDAYGVHLDNDGQLVVTGCEGIDTLIGIETLQFADATVSVSSLTPENDAIFLGFGSYTGTDAADEIYAGGDTSSINGGAGNDTITLTSLYDGDVTVDGGSGTSNHLIICMNDYGDAGGWSWSSVYGYTSYDGTNRIWVDGSTSSRSGADVISTAANITFSNVWVTIVGSSGADDVDMQSFSTSFVRIYGNTGDDYLMGSVARGSDLWGEVGNDTLFGGNFADTLSGGVGDDRLFGDGGSDFASYRDIVGGVQVDLALQYSWQNTGAAGRDYLNSIENIFGSNFGDVLAGDAVDNMLYGGGGDDRLDGGVGNDWLFGNIGGDTLIGGAGNDTIYGYAGIDTAVYSGNYADYSITKTAYGYTVSGADGTDRLYSVEKLSFADRTVIVSSAATSDFYGSGTGNLLLRNADGDVALMRFSGSESNFTNSHYAVGVLADTNYLVSLVADFDGDGCADILWRDADGTLMMSMNAHSGADIVMLGQTVALSVSPGNEWQVVGAGDFDGDGRADILWRDTSYGTLAVWSMDGSVIRSTGVITANPGMDWSVAGVADMDGDGNADILWRCKDGTAALWYMDGATILAGNLAENSPSTDWSFAGTGDFDNDGQADVLWRNRDGTLAMWLGSGEKASLSIVPDTSWTVSLLSDIDGDGMSDIVFTNADGAVAYWKMDGTAIASTVLFVNTLSGYDVVNGGQSNEATVVAPRDFDASGTSDILWRNADGTVAIWLMDGAIVSGGGLLAVNPGSGWSIRGTGDFDGDGKADIVWRNSDGTVALWAMNGTTIAGSAIVGAVSNDWGMEDIADFDGDGNVDILWRNVDGTAAVWLMDGATRTSSALLSISPGPEWSVVGTGDFNGDGKADILWQNASGAVAMWMMNGTSIGSSGIAADIGTVWGIAGTGDFDGDGKTDLLWRNGNTGEVAVWLMDGTTRLSSAVLDINPGTGWNVMGIGDYDGDGNADILWRNTGSGDAALWMMSGTSRLSGAMLSSQAGTSWSAVS